MPIYLYLDIFTLFFPLVFSFDKRVHFVSKWKFLFPAIILVAIFFLIWDYVFTEWGIWWFNPEYLVGIYIGNLPLEELLFFLVVPFACVFIYQALRTYLPRSYFFMAAPYITTALSVGLLLLAGLHYTQYYTALTFALTGLGLPIAYFWRGRQFMGWFYLAYLVHLIPFLLVNGFLTSIPVVEYNNAHNLGIRLISIPVEDTIYSMLLLLMNLVLYDYFQTIFTGKRTVRP